MGIVMPLEVEAEFKRRDDEQYREREAMLARVNAQHHAEAS